MAGDRYTIITADSSRLRNWDNEMRNSQGDEDRGVGDVILPNTVPPFFPAFVLFVPFRPLATIEPWS